MLHACIVEYVCPIANRRLVNMTLKYALSLSSAYAFRAFIKIIL